MTFAPEKSAYIYINKVKRNLLAGNSLSTISREKNLIQEKHILTGEVEDVDFKEISKKNRTNLEF